MNKVYRFVTPVLLLISLISCKTTREITNDNIKSSFPITVISGEVQLSINGYINRSVQLDPMYILPQNPEESKRIDEFNRDVQINDSTEKTISTSVFKKEGESYFYSLKDDEILNISITAMTDHAVIECSSHIYEINRGDYGVSLVFKK